MSLTHPNPFAWKSNPPMPELAGFLREMSGKTPPKPIQAGAVRQPPAFRKPKPSRLTPIPREKRKQAARNGVCRDDSSSGQLRAMLLERGPMTRMQLGTLAGISSKAVGDLLKQDKHVKTDKSVFPQRYYVASNPPGGVTP